MVVLKLSTVFLYLLCLQVSKGFRSSRRFEERLNKLEEELVTERRHRREDVEALSDQLEFLRQTCGCDTSKQLSKTQNVQEKTMDYSEPSVASLRMAFKQEKEMNARTRNELKDSTRAIKDIKDKIVNEVNIFKLDIKTDIAATERRFMDIRSADMDNMKRFVTNTEQSVNKTVSSVRLELDSFKKQIIHNTSTLFVSMDMKIVKVASLNLTHVEVCPRSGSGSGVYYLSSTSPTLDNSPMYCDTTTDGGGWLVFHRRQDGSVDFYHGWEKYKEGFGSPSSEFWWGLERLHAATRDRPREMRVDMEDFFGNKVYAHYTSFSIASESQMYAIFVSGYSGTAGDSLGLHSGVRFSTWDREHDQAEYNCAEGWNGAWWFGDCFKSHLNGKYQFAGGPFPKDRGPVWWSFNDKKAVKFAEMKIRY